MNAATQKTARLIVAPYLVGMVRAHPGRCRQVHFKDDMPQTFALQPRLKPLLQGDCLCERHVFDLHVGRKGIQLGSKRPYVEVMHPGNAGLLR